MDDPDFLIYDEDRISRSDRISQRIIWLIAGIGIGILTALFVTDAAAQEGTVDNAVIFIADISNSMNSDEVTLVRSAHASAIGSHEVITAIEAGAHQRSAFAYIEFAAEAKIVVDWTIIETTADAVNFGAAIMEERPPLGSQTAMGAALVLAEGLIRSMPFDAMFVTVDVAGDGKNNSGVRTEVPRGMILASGATINGMPMPLGADTSDLVSWYEKNVVGGPRHFNLPLERIEDMPMALRRKLIMEIGAGPRDGEEG